MPPAMRNIGRRTRNANRIYKFRKNENEEKRMQRLEANRKRISQARYNTAQEKSIPSSSGERRQTMIFKSTSNANTVMKMEVSVAEQKFADCNSVMKKDATLEECRACLERIDKQTAYNLFEAWYTAWAVQGAAIADDLSKFADIEISELDKHSKVICPKCYSRLADACKFIITVQTSDSILRQRAGNTSATAEGVWPLPILLNTNGNVDLDNRIEIEVKQEVLSEDESGANLEQDWEPNMDIKIEPEEISAPVQSNVQVNGSLHKTWDVPQDSNESSSKNNGEYLDNAIKQEPQSGDELLEAVPDLPLDCMLCFKEFNSVSGLKAHVISQHSYGAVKRKAVHDPSPKKKKTVKEHACNSCDQSFATSTDLMVHRASHSEHVCYVCDRKFGSFRQLTRHSPRCHKKHAPTKQVYTRPPPRPQQLLKPTKNTSKPQKHDKTEEIKIKPKDPPIKEMVQELVQTWPSTIMNIKSTQTQSKDEPDSKVEIGFVQDQQNLEITTNDKLLKNDPEDIFLAEEIKQEAIKTETKLGPFVKNVHGSVQEPISQSLKVDNEKSALSENMISEPDNPENRFLVFEIEENKIESQKQNKSPNNKIEVELTEGIQKESTLESLTGPSSEDLRVNLSQKLDSSPENIYNILSPELKVSNTDHNINDDERLHPESLLETEEENSLDTDPLLHLPNEDKFKEKFKNLGEPNKPYSLLTKETVPSVIQKTELANQNKETSNILEENTSTIDELSEMKVHLAINPLNKNNALFETDIDLKDIKCGDSESCEPKLMSVISEQSDIQHS